MGEGTGDVVAVQIALCGDVGKTNLESEDDLSALKSSSGTCVRGIQTCMPRVTGLPC